MMTLSILSEIRSKFTDPHPVDAIQSQDECGTMDKWHAEVEQTLLCSVLSIYNSGCVSSEAANGVEYCIRYLSGSMHSSLQDIVNAQGRYSP